MQRRDNHFLLSATDLSSFLGCRHRTGLDMAVAAGELRRPSLDDPFLAALRQRGIEHEARHVEWLRAEGLRVVDLSDIEDREARFTRTEAALAAGADVVVQAALRGGDWMGYADILRRVPLADGVTSRFGAWAYEAWDTKLARETRGGTILQLALYSDLLAALQGVTPEHFHVVSPLDVAPHHQVHTYRVDDYAAYYCRVRADLLATVAQPYGDVQDAHYPEPVEQCDVCHWWGRCNARRRKDDHLSFIAGIGRGHRTELSAQDVTTLAAAAALPLPIQFKPSRGSADTYERLAHQARLQHEQRTTGTPRIDLLPVQDDETAAREGPAGLRRLPAPSPGDIFLDLEGARFGRDGEPREYLFGVLAFDSPPSPRLRRAGQQPDDASTYRCCWAFDDGSEKAAFEAVMDAIAETLAAHPDAHVYHFNHYEPTAFKRLMGRHATRAEELDQLLRGERLVDLYPIVRQALRAGVESYSIKQLEQYYGFTRSVDLRTVTVQLQALELAIESGAGEAISAEMRQAVEGYNADDCHSAARLRDWLEELRARTEAGGTPVPRPEPKPAEASEDLSDLDREVEALRARLLDGLTPEAGQPTHADHPRWLLAYLIDWHRREFKAQWWEYFRLKALPGEDLHDERKALAGLQFVDRVGFKIGKSGKPTKSVIDRYTFPAQELELRSGEEVWGQEDGKFATIVALDRAARTVDLEKGPSRADVHPSAVFAHRSVPPGGMQRAVMALADRVLSGDTTGAGCDLLYRRTPRLRSGPFAAPDDESATDAAVRIVTDLDDTTLAIQGPPGAGKTYTGARMILSLAGAGLKVGVTAVSHKVIRNLLDAVREQAEKAGAPVRLAHKPGESDERDDETVSGVREVESNPEALRAIVQGEVDVLGGTAWLWARPEFAGSVDVLFVDEAGQMSLANALAVSGAARSLVLLGDPQQLEQPQKAAHPDGVDVSALQHVIGTDKTMPADRGIFMDETWRLAPAVCDFTSELFYERALRARAGLEAQRLSGAGPFDGAGLWWVPVDHDGNRNASDEEVREVAHIVEALLGTHGQPPARWTDAAGVERPLTPNDFRIVAPFNAQVNRLADRLAPLGVPVGTVDRFQGQTAVVVVYSMATSRPEDAPRGMEFLYSLNRLNVATSRARCAAIIVASPRLLSPECRTPRQMQLANALCRFAEIDKQTGRIC